MGGRRPYAMQQDRFDVPKSLEKAFEVGRQLQSDYELIGKKAQDWEQIVARGRRMRTVNRWRKPIVGVLARAVVVLLAVVVPQHLTPGKQIADGRALIGGG